MSYAEHQAEHAAELARIREAAERARLTRAAAAYARAEGPPAPQGSTRRRAACKPGGRPPTARPLTGAPLAVHAPRRNATFAASDE
jgi:hypothetical protein